MNRSGQPQTGAEHFDLLVIGGGIAGMATAARAQTRGLRTLVLEAHGQPGGCAGYFVKQGFSFDVGATTLVDFEPGGVGGQFLDELGLTLAADQLDGYRAWLPDRTVDLHREPALWHAERLRVLGDTPAHHRFWALMDDLARAFWAASRAGIRLPWRTPADLVQTARALPARDWPLARYLTWTLGDALRAHGLEHDAPLRGLLSMLLEDTVHAHIEHAPLINGALGITIRGAGLTRAHGGMRGFWQALVARYRALGGVLRVGTTVQAVASAPGGGFSVSTRRGAWHATQVVSSLPLWNTARLAPPAVVDGLRRYAERDESGLGGALVVFLGVPDSEVAGQTWTHHQLLQDYTQPLGTGNNMFISVSAPNDALSAPLGWRAVMISTHCELAPWWDLPNEATYQAQKAAVGAQLVDYARRVYPQLGVQARVQLVATPRTYARYTQRYRGAVGGVRQTLTNTNFAAVPYATALPGFWQAGDTTWPGLGTVACILGSRHVADAVYAYHTAHARRAAPRAASAGPAREKAHSGDAETAFHERTTQVAPAPEGD